MWRARLARTWDWIRSRRLVGEDEHHLYYCEFIAKDKPDRRYVEYKDRDITNSSDRMPIEWWSWLHNRRKTVPTAEEIARSEQHQETLAQRVAILEAEDEKQRLRQFSGTAQEAGRAERRAARRKNVMLELTKAASPAGAVADEANLVVTPTKAKGPGDGEVERNEREDPTGAGESFQPGSWNPSGTRKRGK